MSTPIRVLVLCSVLVLALGTAAYAKETNLDLVKDGKANATIVIAADPTPAANLASLEMQYLVEKMTGAKLPIADDSKDVSGIKILIGESSSTRELGLDSSKYHQMQKLIKFYSDALVLLGRDDKAEDCRPFPPPTNGDRERSMIIDYYNTVGAKGPRQMVHIPGMYDYQGSLRATYRFLEEWCGVRFFGPMPINLHIPETKDLSVTGSTDLHRSGINSKYGSMGIFGRSGGTSMYGLRPTAQQALLHYLRARWGGEPWYINHTFAHFNYKRRFTKPVEPGGDDKNKRAEYEQHKKDFEREIPGLIGVRKDGKSANQFCFKNKEFIKQVAKDARDFFDGKLGDNVDEHTRNLQGRSDTFFLVPNDVGGYCECEKCEPLHKCGFERGLAFNGGWASDYVFDLVNAVARKVARTHPDKYVGTLAYEGYYWPPTSFEMEKNVQMAPCMHTKNWRNSPHCLDNEDTHYKEWVRLAKEKKMAPLAMWNYDFDAGVMTAYYPVSRGKLVQRYIRDGVKHVFHCGAPSMVEMYVTYRLYEDPELDPQELVADFFTKYYGPAARPMQDLYGKLEAYSSDPRNRYLAVQKSYVHDRIALFDAILTPERLALLRMDMNKARELGKEEPYATRLASAESALVTRYEEHALRFFRERNIRRRKTLERYDSLARNYIASVISYPGYHYLAQYGKPDDIVNGFNMLEQNPSVVADLVNKSEPNTVKGDTFEFPTREVRYVRLQNVRHLCEISVFTDHGEEVARDKQITGSSGFPKPERDVKFINDGVEGKDSAWWANPPYWAEIDLGKVYDVNKIWMQPWWDDGDKGRASKYCVMVSRDGNDWNQLGTRKAKLDLNKGAFLWGRQEAAGAWIMFDLGGVHALAEMHIWNYNDSKGNTRYGMKDVEIAYAAGPEELFEQNWIKLPVKQLQRALKEPRKGAENIIDFGGKKVRYVYIHTLGGAYHDANGTGNWNPEAKEEKECFKVGIGQVRFYGKPLQMPKPDMTFAEEKIKLTVPGIEDAEIHYTTDDTVPTRESPLYRGLVEVEGDVIIRSRAFRKGKIPSGSTMHEVRYRELLAPLEVAKGKPIESSGEAQNTGQVGTRGPEHINDGQEGKSSAWWAAAPPWATIDLGKEYEIDHIWVQPWWDEGPNGRVARYTVESSVDGKEWKQVIAWSNNEVPSTGDGDIHRFDPVTARYVRIKGLDYLCEFQVYRAK
jgi:hypothetical protein